MENSHYINPFFDEPEVDDILDALLKDDENDDRKTENDAEEDDIVFQSSSSFLDPSLENRDYEEFEIEISEEQLDGKPLDIEFDRLALGWSVKRFSEKSLSTKLKLFPKDIITSVDGESSSGIDYSFLTNTLHSEGRVKIVVLRSKDSEQTVNVKQEVLPDQRGTRQPKQNDSPQPGIGSFSQHARGSSQQPESSSRQGSSSQQSVSSSKQLTSSVQQSGSSNQQSVSSTQHLGNSSQQRSSTQQPVSSSQQSGSSSSWPRRSSQVQDNARPKIKGELWSFSKEKLDDASLKAVKRRRNESVDNLSMIPEKLSKQYPKLKLRCGITVRNIRLHQETKKSIARLAQKSIQESTTSDTAEKKKPQMYRWSTQMNLISSRDYESSDEQISDYEDNNDNTYNPKLAIKHNEYSPSIRVNKSPGHGKLAKKFVKLKSIKPTAAITTPTPTKKCNKCGLECSTLLELQYHKLRCDAIAKTLASKDGLSSSSENSGNNEDFKKLLMQHTSLKRKHAEDVAKIVELKETIASNEMKHKSNLEQLHKNLQNKIHHQLESAIGTKGDPDNQALLETMTTMLGSKNKIIEELNQQNASLHETISLHMKDKPSVSSSVLKKVQMEKYQLKIQVDKKKKIIENNERELLLAGNRTAEAEKKLRVSNDQLRAIVRENDERKKKVAQGNETMRSKIHEQEQNIKALSQKIREYQTLVETPCKDCETRKQEAIICESTKQELMVMDRQHFQDLVVQFYSLKDLLLNHCTPNTDHGRAKIKQFDKGLKSKSPPPALKLISDAEPDPSLKKAQPCYDIFGCVIIDADGKKEGSGEDDKTVQSAVDSDDDDDLHDDIAEPDHDQLAQDSSDQQTIEKMLRRSLFDCHMRNSVIQKNVDLYKEIHNKTEQIRKLNIQIRSMMAVVNKVKIEYADNKKAIANMSAQSSHKDDVIRALQVKVEESDKLTAKLKSLTDQFHRLKSAITQIDNICVEAIDSDASMVKYLRENMERFQNKSHLIKLLNYQTDIIAKRKDKILADNVKDEVISLIRWKNELLNFTLAETEAPKRVYYTNKDKAPKLIPPSSRPNILSHRSSPTATMPDLRPITPQAPTVQPTTHTTQAQMPSRLMQRVIQPGTQNVQIAPPNVQIRSQNVQIAPRVVQNNQGQLVQVIGQHRLPVAVVSQPMMVPVVPISSGTRLMSVSLPQTPISAKELGLITTRTSTTSVTNVNQSSQTGGNILLKSLLNSSARRTNNSREQQNSNSTTNIRTTPTDQTQPIVDAASTSSLKQELEVDDDVIQIQEQDPLFIGCDDGLEGFDDFGDIAADEQDDITDDPLNSINVSSLTAIGIAEPAADDDMAQLDSDIVADTNTTRDADDAMVQKIDSDVADTNTTRDADANITNTAAEKDDDGRIDKIVIDPSLVQENVANSDEAENIGDTRTDIDKDHGDSGQDEDSDADNDAEVIMGDADNSAEAVLSDTNNSAEVVLGNTDNVDEVTDADAGVVMDKYDNSAEVIIDGADNDAEVSSGACDKSCEVVRSVSDKDAEVVTGDGEVISDDTEVVSSDADIGAEVVSGDGDTDQIAEETAQNQRKVDKLQEIPID